MWGQGRKSVSHIHVEERRVSPANYTLVMDPTFPERKRVPVEVNETEGR